MGTHFYFRFLLIIGLLTGLSIGAANAQEIKLDGAETCGDLQCYPALDDPNIFYYLPDQPRIAVQDGKPQFSFLKYARMQENSESGTGRAGGGGIVHFLVTYGASQSRIAKAESALQEKHPDAKIAGPVIYRKGSFALVTSFQEDNTLHTKTLAVGKAPLMEGQKTAVSLALTPEGAEVLWESFHSATPDISLVFDMEFAGIREPYEATLEADWSQITKHDQISAGVKYAWFGADVDVLFQELRQSGAVKITTKGESAALDRILESANSKLLNIMFEASTNQELEKLRAEKKYENLDEAMKLLKEDKKSASLNTIKIDSRQFAFNAPKVYSIIPSFIGYAYADSKSESEKNFDKAEILFGQKNYQEAIKYYKLAIETDKTGESNHRGVFLYNIGQCYRLMQDYINAISYYRQSEKLMTKDEEKALAKRWESEVAAKIYNNARRLDDAALAAKWEAEATQKALDAYLDYSNNVQPTGQREKDVDARIAFLSKKLEDANVADVKAGNDNTKEAPGVDKQPTTDNVKSTADQEKELANALKEGIDGLSAANKPAASNKSTAANAGVASKAKPAATSKAATKPQVRKDKSPGFSLVASYKMRRIKRSGKLVYQMNQMRSETQSFVMTENIGNLYHQWGKDKGIFRAVTIDDPVFKQRDIVVTLDGQDIDSFSRYLNFVTVKLRKTHQAGHVTRDEVIITPELFSRSGNHFVLHYGWHDDDNRDRWLSYEYQVSWSFHGGNEINSGWLQASDAMLALTPPHRYRAITFEADGKSLRDADVRHAVITVNSDLQGKTVTRTETVKNTGEFPVAHLVVPQQDDKLPQVQITWYLKGGKTIKGNSQPLESNIVYWDELPKGE
ncbi:MAG: tetratricopeptide repeat protein [Gammaproteobacteria bacterium]|nr:tetratricopeptide repeat protein [Gammaproteobacteria bacterium]